MAKDHRPDTLHRPSGYESDLELAEKTAARVNTSFGSRNHNVYIHNRQGTHEHFFYDPATARSGWHGANYPTRSNHPQGSRDPPAPSAGTSKEASMQDREQFLARIRCDPATIAKIEAASKNRPASRKKAALDDGGRERGDEGPGRLGREPGNKVGAIRSDMKATAKTPAARSGPAQGGHSGGKTPSQGGGHGQGAASGGRGGQGGQGGHGGHGGQGGQGGHGGHR